MDSLVFSKVLCHCQAEDEGHLIMDEAATRAPNRRKFTSARCLWRPFITRPEQLAVPARHRLRPQNAHR